MYLNEPNVDRIAVVRRYFHASSMCINEHHIIQFIVFVCLFFFSSDLTCVVLVVVVGG